MSEPLRLLVICAHPDDAEYKAGGLAAIYRALGDVVRFVSVTNGDAGHQKISGPELALRRREESAAAAATLGLQYDVWDHPDGRLFPTLALREQVIRLIREDRPDLVLTHRPNDYHPDHRATSQLVQDAAYLLTVPAICREVPHLPRDPVIGYLSDEFTRPYSFDPSVVIDIGPVWSQKMAMLDAHASQFYEWLPFNSGCLLEVPTTAEKRLEWLSARMIAKTEELAERWRERLVATYGRERGQGVMLAEAFEASEYGAPLDQAATDRLFPFLEAARR